MMMTMSTIFKKSSSNDNNDQNNKDCKDIDNGEQLPRVAATMTMTMMANDWKDLLQRVGATMATATMMMTTN